MSYLSRIAPTDRRRRAQVDALLEQEGIQRDGNLDYTCGLFDEDGALLATGSCFGPTLRCLAVDHAHQGEGLLNQVLTHLTEYQAERGCFQLFLYTKCQSAKFFGDLGFYEIARVDGKLVFMENRRDGFARYCQKLSQHRRGDAAAIVMNANPFTRGHLYLVEQAAKEWETVHLFVLSEDASLVPYPVRWKLVTEGVAHLPNVVCHPSGPYIISAATFPSYFLKDADTVILTHAALDIAVFGKIAAALGIVCRYVGEEPGSHVTALYNQAMAQRLPEMGIDCRIIPRLTEGDTVVSASTVRKAIHDGDLEAVRPWVPETTWRYLTSPAAASVLQAIQRSGSVVHY